MYFLQSPTHKQGFLLSKTCNYSVLHLRLVLLAPFQTCFQYKRHLSTNSICHTPNSIMDNTKELSKGTKNKIVDLHQPGKIESALGKQLCVKNSTVGEVTTDNLPQSEAPCKSSPWGFKMITSTATRNPRCPTGGPS